MFSKQITTSDAFVDMPMSSQLLYFHLNMEADDDGFVANPNRITKMVGANSDDLKILLAKRFLLSFENGVVVIKHWLLHNAVRKDMYKETQYLEEKKTLQIKDNGVYTEVRNESVTKPLHRLDQIRLGKDRIDKISTEPSSGKVSFSQEGAEILKSFEAINPSCKSYYNRSPQRKACDTLIQEYSLERVKTVIEKTLPKTNGLQFFPTITTPIQLLEKWTALESAVRKYQAEKSTALTKNKVAF